MPRVDEHHQMKFHKQAFLIRKCDVCSSNPDEPPFIWSIENHVMIAKWIPTRVRGQFQITNRYNLWNVLETDRYIPLEVSQAELTAARESGVVQIPSLSSH